MDQKFTKLRFKELAAAVTIGGALALHTSAAVAATGSLKIDAGNAHWYLNTNITFSTTSSAWGFSEASLKTTATHLRTDAYDGALSWHVNLPPAASNSAGAYVSPGGILDISQSIPTNPAVGTTVTGNVQVLAGLNVTGQVYFSPVKAVVRSLLSMQNPTGAAITVTVANDSNLGSDNNTFYQATSSGDATYDATDNWTVSSQGNPLIQYDPVLTFVFAQTGAAVRPTPIVPVASGSDKIWLAYTVTIPAGQTRRLMMFSQLSDTVAHAEADAVLFNSNASLQGTDYLSGLTAAQDSEIVNFNGLTPVAPAPVPTLSQWALIGMASLLGMFGLSRLGLYFGRRRQTRSS